MSFLARGKTHKQKAKLLLPCPLFRHPSEGVGLSASNNLIKKNTQKLTQYFVFSWFQVQSSGQTRLFITLKHAYSLPPQFLLEMSPYLPQLTMSAISCYECPILSVSQTFCTLPGLLVLVLLTIILTWRWPLLSSPLPCLDYLLRFLGTEDQSDRESWPWGFRESSSCPLLPSHCVFLHL